MNRPQCNLQLLESFGVALIVGTGLSARVGLPVLGGTTWKEEVLLHDGSKLIATRSQSYGGGAHELGQPADIKDQTITFSLPGSSKIFTWKSEYGEDIQRSNFILVALHVLDGSP